MDILKLSGGAILAVTLVLVIRQTKPEQAVLITAAAGVTLLAAAIAIFYPSVSYITQIAGNTAYGPYLTVLLKTLGVGFAAQTTADICRDAGENAVAAKVELIGKAEIMLISLPLLKELLSTVSGILYE